MLTACPTESITTRTTTTNREQLILEHLPQVRMIARRIHERLPGTVSLDDLISSGIIGLIGAIDRFDELQGVKLRTFAEFKIRGAILDSLRSLDWAPRSQRKRARVLQQTAADIENRSHSKATVDEIARELGISIAECQEWMRDTRHLTFESIDTSSKDDEGNTLSRQLASTEDWLPSQNLEKEELRRVIAEAICHMPRQERTMLSLMFHEELSLREISRVMGLHESRISQIKVQALGRMREILERNWPKKGTAVKAATAGRRY